MALELMVGIIGPGDVTQHAMQHISSIANSVKSVGIYNHGGSFLEQLKTHREIIFNNLPKERKPSVEVKGYPQSDFDRFMNESDVIILNAGAYTPSIFINEEMELAEQFKSLEGILHREARKDYQREVKMKKEKDLSPYRSEEQHIADFITAYHVLKELGSLQEEGYFPKPFRTTYMLPRTLPLVVEYAAKMKKWFDKTGISPATKLLLVNSNSSENCLDAVLSIIPEWRDSAVSLAIDKDRLVMLCNTEPLISIPSNALLDLGVVGDHDAYILPNFGNIKLELFANLDERRIKAFESSFNENKVKLYGKLKDELINFYRQRREKQNLLDQAGKGEIKILRNIFTGEKIISGCFTELGEKYGLSPGEGLCFVDEHTIRWDGEKFEVRKEPQQLDELTTEQFEVCKRAHVELHQRFIKSDFIPLFRFPSGSSFRIDHNQMVCLFRGDSPSEIINKYRQSKPRTEILVPVISEKERAVKLVALDASTSKEEMVRRELVFPGRDLADYIRFVDVATIKGERKIICGFTNDYLVIDPQKLRIAASRGHKLRLPKAREDVKGRRFNYMINSVAVGEERVFLTHSLYGLVAVNPETGQEKQFYNPEKKEGPVRGVKINSLDGNLYFIVGEKIKVYDQAGEFLGEFRSNYSDLECLVFSGENIYASMDAPSWHRSTAVLWGVQDGKYQDLKPLKFGGEIPKGDIVLAEGFERKKKSHLLLANRDVPRIYQIEKKDGLPNQLKPDGSFGVMEKSFSTSLGRLAFQAKIAGLAVDVHAYVSYGMGGRQRPHHLYEVDLDEKKIFQLYDFIKQSEYVLPTLAVLHTEGPEK